jgi:drug/metabolite transporter (DMT)-like permease
MQYLGEIISLVVAVMWTATALFADQASRRIGAMSTNLFRMIFSAILLAGLLWIVIGHPYPAFADGKTWLWMGLSSLVGYVFGDFCLFNAYVVIGARFGQLFMTLAPPFAAIAGWVLLGETLSWRSWLAMAVTLTGIAISILSRSGSGHHLTLKLPLKGVLLGIGAGLGQGVGLVLSKIGMQHYAEALPSDAPAAFSWAMPFASTMIRSLTGMAGFFIWMVIAGQLPQLRAVVHNRTGMKFTALTTLFGPFIGVSLSLMAVQYARAGIASTLMALTPVLILFPYALIYKQKITPKEILGVIVSMTGVALFFLI